MDVDLAESASAKFDASGAGLAVIGPVNQFQTWNVTNIAISTVNGRAGTVINEAKCQVFRGSGPTGGQLVGSTLSGSSGDSDSVSETLYPGMKLWAKWTVGDAGDVGTIALTGTITVPG